MPFRRGFKLARLATVLTLAAGGSGGVWYYQYTHSADRRIAELEREREQLKEQKRQLETFVQRLNEERRVAEILVSRKEVDGVTSTTLTFVEYAHDGTTLPPKKFTIDGKVAHIDAMVIKFEHDFVAQNDPLKGRSIALFTKLYSDTQTPAAGFPIDEPDRIPDIYRGAAQPEKQMEFERDLWHSFWRLTEDKEYRKSKGVRVADGEGVWGRFEPERLYTVTLDANGGMNLTSELHKGAYREMMKQAATQGTDAGK